MDNNINTKVVVITGTSNGLGVLKTVRDLLMRLDWEVWESLLNWNSRKFTGLIY